jgi:acetyl esterase
MPLHPAAQQMVDGFANVDAPRLWDIPIEEARAQGMLFASIGCGTPVEVGATEDRVVPGPHGEIPVRVYTPKPQDAASPLPAVVYLHGGGWVFMGIETHDTICRRLTAASGCVVVSVDYRLAPEHPFPVPVDDCYAALCWVANNTAELGTEPGLVAVMGDSAGGNLAAAVTLVARERGEPRLAAQVLVYPALDPARDTGSYVENGTGYILDEPGMEWFWRQYLQHDAHAEDPFAAPARARDLEGLPPTTVVTAEFDPLRDEGEIYASRLAEAGCDAYHHRMPGMLHGFLGMPEMFPEADDAMAIAARALRDAFTAAGSDTQSSPQAIIRGAP